MSSRYMYLKNGDELVCQERFDCKAKKKSIVEKWKSRYGKKFNDLTIAEDPLLLKVKKEKPKEGRQAYAHLFFRGKKTTRGSNKRWNGYKD